MRQTRVFVRSFGCSSNLAEGEFMVGCLSEAGFDVVETVEDADVLIYNTCAVKTPTENRVVEVLKKAAEMRDKRLLVTGCLPLVNLERLKAQVKFDGILGPDSALNIVEAVDKILRDEQVICLDNNTETTPCLDLPRHSANSVLSIVPVSRGCLGSCSYCCVRNARGRLRSFSADEIIRRIERDIGAGAREVWLTGQDMACYGRDLDLDLIDLLDRVCGIDGDFLVRIGMMTPNLVLEMLPELVEAYRNEHVFKFLHLPVQSGDDDVLRRMNRFYSANEFKHIIDSFRKTIPDLTLATDIICGFPAETDEAFEHTLKLIDEIKPDIVNISKFFPRPRTSAERMTSKVHPTEVKKRSQRMSSLVKRISSEKNRAWSNWKGQILLDEPGKQPYSLIGRNFSYKPIVVKTNEESLLGSFVSVQVTKTFQTYLEAEIIKG